MKPRHGKGKRSPRLTKIKPGDVYEDGNFHPCLCLGIEDLAAFGVSLIDGTYPRTSDLQLGGVRKLTLAQVAEWKFKGRRKVWEEWDAGMIRKNGEHFLADSILSPAHPDARKLDVEPLNAHAFSPFGEVISPDAARTTYAINEGTSQRFHALGHVECDGGAPILSIFRAQPRALPFVVEMLERHPLGSQAFVPLSKGRYLVVVADSPEATPRAFLANDGQGVNFRRGTWHHPLLALDAECDFLVVDREGDGGNCDEARLPKAWLLHL